MPDHDAFKQDNPGCGCCDESPPPPCGWICFKDKASGCLADATYGLAGTRIDVTKAGAAVGTCYTDSKGECCVAIDEAGSYAFTATPPAGSGLNTVSGLVVAICATNTVTLTHTVQADWICTECCVYPVKPTTLTDAEGSVALSGWNDDLISDNANRTISGVTVCDAPQIGCAVQRQFRTKSGATNVRYFVECLGGEWGLRVRWHYAASETQCTTNEDGSSFRHDPDWAYTNAAAACSAFYTVDNGLCEVHADCAVTCEAGAFTLVASVPSAVDPVYGFTIPPPCGNTVTMSS